MSEYDFQQAISGEIEKEKLARRILGVREDADVGEIKKAFWLLAMDCHPDKNRGDHEAERRFQNIVNAYDYLVKDRRERVVLRDEEGSPGEGFGGYRTENQWGYFLWWRENFFDERYGLNPQEGGSGVTEPAKEFDEVVPESYEDWYTTGRGKRIDEEEKGALSRILDEGEGRLLLDVGCGTGHFTTWCAGRGFRAVGVDTSESLVRYAAGRYGNRFALADGRALPFADGTFQVAMAVTLMEFARYPELLVREMYRVAAVTLVFLMLNPDSELSRERKSRGKGVFATATFWPPSKLKLLLKDVLPRLPRGSIYREIHEDFYVLSLDKGKRA
jgi:SAM-dependent methyltransferase